MRDRRFVAAHRGGPLEKDSHILLARWAADCAEAVLDFFAQASDDERPKRAIETARQWANGEVKTGVAMKASVASHAAAQNDWTKLLVLQHARPVRQSRQHTLRTIAWVHCFTC